MEEQGSDKRVRRRVTENVIPVRRKERQSPLSIDKFFNKKKKNDVFYLRLKDSQSLFKLVN